MFRSGVLILLTCTIAAVSHAKTTSIYKVDFPDKGFCGLETNVTKSKLNPHWIFPMTFGGFTEGNCSDVGFTKYVKTEVVEMHPVPGVHHNLTFDVYAPTQTSTITIQLKDPARPKRDVKIKFCMPDGDGPWPLYVFGHGAGCIAEDYQYFCQVAATAMIYQDSPAGSIFPVDFDSASAALDAKFLAKQLPEMAQSEKSSPLYKKLDGTVIMGGHSMGGGMTALSVGQDSASVNGVALFAPGLYTKPDATPFLKNITMPALIVSGSMDCGQNALDKQAQPAFAGLASKSKVLLVLKGANHCQWIQPFEKGLGVCSTFEKNECHGIERATQHNLGASLVSAFSSGVKSTEEWSRFEEFLAAGEAQGTWTYISSKTSPSSKTVHNDCPCSSGSSGELVI